MSLKLKDFTIGLVVYRSVYEECSEGWDATSFAKTTVSKIEKYDNDRSTAISFSDASTIYFNTETEEQCYSQDVFYSTKEELLKYILEAVLETTEMPKTTNALVVNELNIGDTVYRTVHNECCEGWDTESYEKDTLNKITENDDFFVYTFDKTGDVYVNKDGTLKYADSRFYSHPQELLDYISNEVLV